MQRTDTTNRKKEKCEMLKVYEKDLNEQERPTWTVEDVIAARTDNDKMRMLVEQNLRFLYKLCYEFAYTQNPRIFTAEDFMGSAVETMMYCVERYDPTHKSQASFLTYVRHAVIHALIKFQERCADIVQWKNPRGNPRPRVGLYVEELKDMPYLHDSNRGIATLTMQLMPLEAWRSMFTSDGDMERAETKEDNEYRVYKFLSLLNDRERYIITHKYGLNGNTPKTYEQIGWTINLTDEGVRRIEKRAIQKMRRRGERE